MPCGAGGLAVPFAPPDGNDAPGKRLRFPGALLSGGAGAGKPGA